MRLYFITALNLVLQMPTKRSLMSALSVKNNQKSYKNEKTTLEIEGDSALNLPKNLEFVEFSKETLILAPERGNFIACFNKEQLEIFKNLQQNSINEAEKKAKNKDDFNFIVGQILDREFFEIPLKLSDEYDTAQVYLTNACNLACPHCYMNSGVANKNELSLE